MIVSHVHVRNYRSVLDEGMSLNALTALVGENGAGKSSFLNALRLFFDPASSFDDDDHYSGDLSESIEVTLKFTDFSVTEQEIFADYIEEESMEVVKTFRHDSNGKNVSSYHGYRSQIPSFADVRRAGTPTNITNSYKALREKEEFAELPTVRSKDQALTALTEWEQGHQDKCERMRDESSFFGSTSSGTVDLSRFVQFMFVPAVRDASQDATEGKSSTVTELVNRVVRGALEGRQELEELRHNTRDRFRAIMDGATKNELKQLETNLSHNLGIYAPDIGIRLDWAPLEEIPVPSLRAQVKVIEDDFEADIGRVGHGIQRAIIMTLLQQLESVKIRQYLPPNPPNEEDISHDSETTDQVTLLLAIEEPELYQHPSRQRLIATVLRSLAEAESTQGFARTQVIYSTHSPLFVGLDRFDDVRVVSRVQRSADRPKVSTVRSATLSKIAKSLQKYQTHASQPFTAESIRARLESILNPFMGEIFFAKLAVLVEGETDRAALLEVARQLGYDFDALGVAVVPCDGKNNIDRPYLILRHLEIGAYVIWDGDYNVKDSGPDKNKYLLRLLGQPEEDWPDVVERTFACFKIDLEATLKEDVGQELFDQIQIEVRQEFGISSGQGTKSPAVYRAIVRSLKERGAAVSSLEKIVTNISQEVCQH